VSASNIAITAHYGLHDSDLYCHDIGTQVAVVQTSFLLHAGTWQAFIDATADTLNNSKERYP
jgi:hypothetical protein